MLTRVLSAALVGIDAYLVEVEVDLAGGLPGYQLVGLPATATVEGKVRIRAALENSGLSIPPRKVSVNLAPADVRKDGAAFDLPIAVGIVAAAGQLAPGRLDRFLLLGELSLSGAIKPVRGGLSVAILARSRGLEGVIVPRANVAEAALVGGVRACGAATLAEVVAFLAGAGELPAAGASGAAVEGEGGTGGAGAGAGGVAADDDLADVRGQAEAKRALEIAAAGGHNLVLVGEPGCGKTMLARRLPSVLPTLDVEEALAVTRVHSVAGALGGAALCTRRPFRAPHHSISTAGLVGGGPLCRPGEVSLAHLGVLFLDEVPEFGRAALEALRQPLEDGRVNLVRVQRSVTFPAAFTLVAAANPCPCGFLGSTVRSCTCSPPAVARYRARLSGPLLDRIDLQVAVHPTPFRDLRDPPTGEGSAAIRTRVEAAREVQRRRLAAHGLSCNAQMTAGLVQRHCPLDALGAEVLERAVRRDGLSVRGVDRVRKVARTIADLRGAAAVDGRDVMRALAYRVLDREATDQPWGPGSMGNGVAVGLVGAASPALAGAAAPALAAASSS
ncbi:MAG: YifB family Mg chelatase-like AAA ATPase [Deltaproteobacteria bacterium]|nr:YifB family Mg chelatase-like AAA ATPase [Deltaproteobacteria bacterium]